MFQTGNKSMADFGALKEESVMFYRQEKVKTNDNRWISSLCS